MLSKYLGVIKRSRGVSLKHLSGVQIPPPKPTERYEASNAGSLSKKRTSYAVNHKSQEIFKNDLTKSLKCDII